MAPKLVRIHGRGHLHFITFTCYRRLPLLRSFRARNIFVEILDDARNRYGFSLVGYVVMPDHIHLLMLAVKAPREEGAARRRIIVMAESHDL
jgi:putative transposase